MSMPLSGTNVPLYCTWDIEGSKKNVRKVPDSRMADEAVQRDLAEHEGPVVGEDLSAEFLDESGHLVRSSM